MHSHSNALFISDLHLTEDRPDCIRAFFSFLEWLPSKTEALFILGDFFEYWVGDDIESPLSMMVAEKLRLTALQKNVSIYFVPGNRDFSIGQNYCDQCSMQLIEDNSVVEISGKRFLISHGDLLCTDDKKYQRFRKIIRHKLVMSLLLALPKSRRIKIALALRQKSQQSFNKRATIIDVNIGTVEQTFEKYGGEIMVHGHTHLADIHYHKVLNKTVTRVVLGDWHTVGWYAKVDDNGAKLHQFSIVSPVF